MLVVNLRMWRLLDVGKCDKTTGAFTESVSVKSIPSHSITVNQITEIKDYVPCIPEMKPYPSPDNLNSKPFERYRNPIVINSCANHMNQKPLLVYMNDNPGHLTTRILTF